MAIHWQVKFKSLRAEEIYTVNIYDSTYSGTPLQLIGGAEPFTTQEDDDDDVFTPVRTQSGYIRIVDDGSVNWRDIIPTTDVDRPVTLTDSNGNVKWQGYMQAQDFGTELYAVPKEISFPVQCAMSTLSRIDVDIDEYIGLANFAAILDYALLIVSDLTFSNLVIQGGADAMLWLIRRVDWETFGETDEEGIFVSKNSVLSVIENVCRYWGWTLRTKDQTIYMTCADDTSLNNFLTLTRQQLTAMAGGTPSGTIDMSGYNMATIGDVFANTQNIDMRMRGVNKAMLTAETGGIDENLIYLYPETVLKDMDDGGYYPDQQSGVEYTSNKGSFTSRFFNGMMLASSIGNSYFNIAKQGNNFAPVIRDAVYKSSVSPSAFCYFETNKPYVIGDGEFLISFDTFTESSSEYFWFGLQAIDADTNDVYYWDGTAWVTTSSTYFKIKSGAAIPTSSCPVLYGYVRLVLVGWDAQVINDMSELTLTYKRSSVNGRYLNTERRNYNKYSAKNDSVVKQEWNESCLFSTENYSKFGSAIVINPNNTYFMGWDYANHREATSITPKQQGYAPIVLATSTQPEQHLVNRIALFWSTSRRKIQCHLRSELIPDITPRYKVIIDGSTMYAISISRNWRDDVTQLKMIQL